MAFTHFVTANRFCYFDQNQRTLFARMLGSSAIKVCRRLNLTAAQKSALKELTDAFASADASAKKSLCTDKPDLSTTPGRMAFAATMAEIRLAGLKAIEPKLQAFYDTLNARQKRAFDTGGRIGGIFNWWGKT